MGFLQANGTRLERDGQTVFLRGFGLGGWLLPEGYMWKLYGRCDRPRRLESLVERLCGKEYADGFWKRYLDSYITEADIQWIAQEGFNCVRLPINARHLDDGSAWPYIDACISWCKKNGVYVILDMHGALGGQTGQNIDDCEHDQPELFQQVAFQDALAAHWQKLATRYREEEMVAGYDLLNEPLPNFFARYNPLLLPLYRRLTSAIREIDPHHLIIVEGLHWATDFSVFEPLAEKPLDSNYMLQFHKYWSAPDVESIQEYIHWSERLRVPLLQGESGENNLDWYAAAFPMYERNRISWSFWSYKKMGCDNSPVSFDQPNGWEKIEACVRDEKLPREEAIRIFNDFLSCIAHSSRNPAVLRALLKRAPLCLPAEHYDACTGHSARADTAEYRMNDSIRIVFANGKHGKVDFNQNAGKAQPPEENLLVLLDAGEEARYRFTAPARCNVRVRCKGHGSLCMTAGASTHCHALLPDWQTLQSAALPQNGTLEVRLACTEGTATLEEVCVELADASEA